MIHYDITTTQRHPSAGTQADSPGGTGAIRWLETKPYKALGD